MRLLNSIWYVMLLRCELRILMDIYISLIFLLINLGFLRGNRKIVIILVEFEFFSGEY